MAEIPPELIEEIKEKADEVEFGKVIITIQNNKAHRVNISESLEVDDIIKKYNG